MNNKLRRFFIQALAFASVVGSQLSFTAAAQPSATGEWSAVQSWPVVAIHVHVLPNGKVLVWPRDGGNQARLWDPGTGTFTPVPLPSMNLFCTGHAFLPDGRLMVTGGHIRDGTGERLAHIFDYQNNTWVRVADMNDGRWYPTSTALPNGESLVISGSTVRYRANPLPQVWQTTGGWRNLTGASLDVPLYPFMHVAPNGKVFNSGPNTTTRYLDTSGTGAWTSAGGTRATYRDYGSSVQYAPGKIVLIGGGDPPVNTAEVIDLNQPTPTWRSVGAMAVARRQMNATLLPDGTVLVTGGTSGAGFNDACNSVFLAELWDPVTEQFTSVASASERRLYHSTSILLPDGRVLNGGGGQPSGENCADADHLTVQLFSPPYLFNGARPVISSAPATVSYGETFFVGTPSGSGISKVNWIRLGSVTHAFDMNQSLNQLSFSQASGGLNVTAPSDPNLCVPGHYMLFILNGTGVPSVASIVKIGVSAQPPSAPTGLVAQGGVGLVNLSWSASAGATSYNVKRSTVNGGPYSTIASPGGTSHTDNTVTGGTTYYYVVSAVNASGESANSGQASATPSAPPPAGNGTGLKGQYYNNVDFTLLRITRTDSTVNFNWANGSPGAGVQGDTFSVQWTGEVQAQFTETYTFYTVTDDGVRLWVNGQQLINDWNNHAATENSGTIALVAGQRYTIQMDYYENTGAASAQLLWSSPSQVKQVIPQTQLYPAP